MLIDWLTLRFPLDDSLGTVLNEKIQAAMGSIVKITPDGVIEWEKRTPDWDAIRSDSLGIYWNVTCDGEGIRYLTIGASPSSLLNAGVNVFGNLSLEDGSTVLINRAGAALGAVLPHWKLWQCRRMDITANFDMGNSAQVKQSLRLLLGTDSPRRRTNSDRKGGDSVYWNPSSTLRAGKAYHKGAHLRHQLKKGNIVIDEDLLILADRLLRLELMLGSMWFRRLEAKGVDWHTLTPEDLAAYHFNFFESLISGGEIEVTDMENILHNLEQHAPTMGRAQSAYNTYCRIRQHGYVATKATMQPKTFLNHQTLILKSGISLSQLCNTNVLQFKMKALDLGAPVLNWSELRRAA
jgi:II/X family phage/plasmid replication protein